MVGVEPGDTSWRVDHTKEIALVEALEEALEKAAFVGLGTTVNGERNA